MSAAQSYTSVELLTLGGPQYRRVSTAPTRPATADEIPIIDLEDLWYIGKRPTAAPNAAETAGTEGKAAHPAGQDDLARAAAKKIAEKAAAIGAAATGAGFFYVTNHGIPASVVAAALEHAQRFFSQPLADKMRVHNRLRDGGKGNGYSPVHSGQINRSESSDAKEALQFRYQPEYDPQNGCLFPLTATAAADLAGAAGAATAALPAELSQGDEWVWDQTAHMPGFKTATLAWWQHCLQLARALVQLFAVALDLPADYFDAVTTRPGSDGLYICYPGRQESEGRNEHPEDDGVGIGSHTDMQCFTLLWQDNSGGLEVLLKEKRGDSNERNDCNDSDSKDSNDSSTYEWVGAAPQPNTLVVNIADFLQRLSNDRFQSTVHRVYNRQSQPRFSMPFFFGFNTDAECAVVPTCVDATHPPRYEPISCGKWRDERMALAFVRSKGAGHGKH